MFVIIYTYPFGDVLIFTCKRMKIFPHQFGVALSTKEVHCGLVGENIDESFVGTMPLPPLPPFHLCKPYSRSLQQHLFLMLQRCKSMRQLTQLHAQLLLNGFSQKCFLLTKLLSFCIASGDVSHAATAFSLVDHPSTTLSNQMLRALSLSPTPLNCLLFYNQMLQRRETFKPNGFTYAFLFSACARANSSLLCQGEQLHARIVSAGFGSNVYVQTNLINMYATATAAAGGTREEAIARARKVFDDMPQRSIVSWNSMLAVYLQLGELHTASEFFGEMPKRDAVSWTAMITGWARAGKASQALELFREMRRARVTPDQVTMIALLSVCTELGDLELGRWIHARLDPLQGGRDRLVSLNNALIHMYIKCGAVDEALHIFHEMPMRSTISWTTMIAGLAMHGSSEDALGLFRSMREKPDAMTFLAVLCTCSHSGRIDEGRHYFMSMRKQHGIRPDVRHYGCMVDMLTRAGRLGEALELVEAMPMRPSDAVWGSLLGGCRRHGEVELAGHVVERLMELKPERAAGYLVLLSNVYAAVSRWEEAHRVRERMVDLAEHKPAGRSWMNPNE